MTTRASAAKKWGLTVAAAVLAAEAAGMLIATGFSAAATVTGKSYQDASGIALTIIAAGLAVALAALANAVRKAKLWSRTPAMLTQLFTGGAAIYLADGHRYEWAIPAGILAVTGIVALFTPATFKALNRDPKQAPRPL